MALPKGCTGIKEDDRFLFQRGDELFWFYMAGFQRQVVLPSPWRRCEPIEWA